jgi:hypothetical protein
MTLRQFAQQLIEDPAYRDTVRTRAIAGTLPPDLETFIWEVADGRLPVAVEEHAAPLPNQSKTLALIRPFSRTAEQQEVAHD